MIILRLSIFFKGILLCFSFQSVTPLKAQQLGQFSIGEILDTHSDLLSTIDKQGKVLKPMFTQVDGYKGKITPIVTNDVQPRVSSLIWEWSVDNSVHQSVTPSDKAIRINTSINSFVLYLEDYFGIDLKEKKFTDLRGEEAHYYFFCSVKDVQFKLYFFYQKYNCRLFDSMCSRKIEQIKLIVRSPRF
ncbi:hypothetical protein [Carboxylicivirga sp. M1479]|uniref:hypothetical protein n=1 Tax=Carboxylicivirga sp. M1479 TaxID=2594476 RepID=UPI0011781974|nr:hypothetical protein [Carboxylicivirga sp. M1479]TRX71761.1 hypothetical protein FNN09_03840 [Carboxylicivirga sp. M1479]